MSSLGVDGQEQPAYRATPTDAIFVPLLNKELKKIVLFFEQQEKELARDITELGEDVELQERLGLAGAERYMDFPEGNLEDDDDESISQSPVARYRKKVPTHTQTLSPILGAFPLWNFVVPFCFPFFYFNKTPCRQAVARMTDGRVFLPKRRSIRVSGAFHPLAHVPHLPHSEGSRASLPTWEVAGIPKQQRAPRAVCLGATCGPQRPTMHTTPECSTSARSPIYGFWCRP